MCIRDRSQLPRLWAYRTGRSVVGGPGSLCAVSHVCGNIETVNAAIDAARRTRKREAGDSPGSPAPGLLWGVGIRQVRIACGLILFSYLLSHFANHALGNVSYDVMSDWLDVHMAFWRHPVVATVFYA